MRMPKYTYDVEHMLKHREIAKYWCVTVSYRLLEPHTWPGRKPTILIFCGPFSHLLWLANHQSTEHGYFKMDSFTEIQPEEFTAAGQFTDMLVDYKDRVMKSEEELE